MKVIYSSLFTLLCLLFLLGCSVQVVGNDSLQSVKTGGEVKNDFVYVSEKENSTIHFKISEITSDIVNLNDGASETPLSGVRYEIVLLSEKELTNEERISYGFEVVTESTLLKEVLGPIHPLCLKDTHDGYRYTLAFETMYKEYPEEELEKLKKERNFQILLKYDGEVLKIESL